MKIHIIPFRPTNNFIWTCPRGSLIVKRGLNQLSDVQIVDNVNEADFYFHTHVPNEFGQKTTEYLQTYDSTKLVFIDWIDEFNQILYPSYFAYFKRSWCFPATQVNSGGICSYKYSVGRPQNMFPFDYAILEEFCREKSWQDRYIDIGCYLRPSCNNRIALLRFCYEIIENFPNKRFNIGEISSGSRSIAQDVYFDSIYFNYLSNTKIVISCQPTWWIGDSRIWEALACGCLLFVDKVQSPIPNQLKPNEHYIEFSFANAQDLLDKLKYYSEHDEESQQIAENAKVFALEHHTSKARMQYVINTLTTLQNK